MCLEQGYQFLCIKLELSDPRVIIFSQFFSMERSKATALKPLSTKYDVEEVTTNILTWFNDDGKQSEMPFIHFIHFRVRFSSNEGCG